MYKLKSFKIIGLSLCFLLIQSACITNKRKARIENVEISNKTKLDEQLLKDTIVFNEMFPMEEFISLIDISTGSLKLRTLPDGSFDHFILIEENRIKYNLEDIKSGPYMMDLQYDFEKKPYKRIYKVIEIESDK